MNVLEIRKKISSCEKYEGTAFLKNAPVIHQGFPSCFNLSFGEYELIKEFDGQYLHYDHDFIYSKIQPCIRHQDWESIVHDSEKRYRYLSVFDMADVSGLIIKKNKDENIAKFTIKFFLRTIKDLGLDLKKLRISYFEGANINDATAGKYEINKYVGPDPLKEYWISLGINENQLIPDKTRDTFLSLRIFGLPTPWGYRNEVNYLHKGKLLDIGTVEHMKFQPVFSQGQIIDTEEFEHSVAVSAVGIERISMAINDMDNIWEVDTIYPLIKKIVSVSKNKNELDANVFVQSIRAIHRIVTDGGEYGKLNKRRKEYARSFYKGLFESAENLEIPLTEELLGDILKNNAELQPFYPELNDSVKKTVFEINSRINAFAIDKSNKGV